MATETVYSSLEKDREIHEFLKSKKYVEAETLLKQRLQSDPMNADTHYLLGVIYQFKGKIGSCISHLKKSLEIDPNHTDSAICLSVLYNDIGKYDEAKAVFEKANQSVARPKSDGTKRGSQLGVDRKFAVKHMELGDLYFRYRRYDEAIEEYSKAISLEPQVTETKIRRAKAYSKKGFVTRAVQELQQLKTDDPNCIDARVQLGLLQFSQGNILDAELEWEQIQEAHPDRKDVVDYLQMCKEARVKGL